MHNLIKTASAALVSTSCLILAIDGAQAISINLNTGNVNYSISGAATLASGLNLTAINTDFYIANDANSRWIGPLPSANTSAPSGNYIYSTVFSLAGLVPSTTTITPLRVASDDLFTSLTLNGNSILSSIAPSSFSAFTTYNINSGLFVSFLNTTNNTLAFTVNNVGSSPNSTGFRAEFTVDAQPVPFEFEATSSLLLIAGYFITKRSFSKKKV